MNAVLRAALVLTFSVNLAPAAEHIALRGRAMGTTWAVTFTPATSSLDPPAIERAISARLEELERRFSTYREDSEVSLFNARNGDEWFPISAETAQVAIAARAISELTGGAFDVTVNPLVRLWGFGPAGPTRAIPTDEAVSIAQSRVGWDRLEVRVSPPALRRVRPGVTVDFSSIAKGFASDALGELLARFGARDHFVQVGGDIKTGGHSVDEVPWRAAIETPHEDQRSVVSIVKLTGQALSTSGDYRNFVIRDGRRLSHIIDPRSGYPAATGLAAVSVIDGSCTRSSALATALFVLGPTQGFKLATEQKLACVFFIRRANTFDRRATPEFEKYVR